MAKLVSLKRSKNAAERPPIGKINGAYPDDEGVAIHLDHDHLTKLGVGGSLKSGDKVGFSGAGKVERSETRTDKDGERHSATIRLHRGSVDHDASRDDQREELRGEIAKNAEAAGKK